MAINKTTRLIEYDTAFRFAAVRRGKTRKRGPKRSGLGGWTTFLEFFWAAGFGE